VGRAAEYQTYPEAKVENAESPLIFILNPASPLSTEYNHVYESTNTSIPLMTFYRSDFLLSFERMKAMLPHAVTYDESIGYKQDWSYNLDISKVSAWLADPRHNIKTIIVNTGTHYNSGQFGGGIPQDAIQELYRSAIEYVSATLSEELRNDQIVFFRSSTAGHSNGHGICSTTTPLSEPVRIKYFHYNWHGQDVFNALWKDFLARAHVKRRYLNIRYLDVSRPSMLRPDAVQSV
jgi:hypothetical protein